MAAVVMDGLLLACHMGNGVCERVRTLARCQGLEVRSQETEGGLLITGS